MVSATRSYGAAIALTSGIYSLWSASTATQAGITGILMAAIGLIVIAHGAVLVTGASEQLGGLSGPLMIGYAVVMLIIQGLLAAGLLGNGSGMGMSDGMGDGMAAGMGIDGGMIALAVLMLVSGIIMTQDDSMIDAGGM